MSNGAVVGAAGAAAAAAIARAIKASGAIVQLEANDFIKILSRTEKPLVVTARGGFLNRRYRYLTNYKGLFFYCEAKEPVMLPVNMELVTSKKIWIP